MNNLNCLEKFLEFRLQLWRGGGGFIEYITQRTVNVDNRIFLATSVQTFFYFFEIVLHNIIIFLANYSL
jgi:hypothetical protein